MAKLLLLVVGVLMCVSIAIAGEDDAEIDCNIDPQLVSKKKKINIDILKNIV